MDRILKILSKNQTDTSVVSLWLNDFLRQLYEHKDYYKENIIIHSNEEFQKLSNTSINYYIELSTIIMDYIIELTNLTLIYNMDSYIQEYRKILLSIYHYSTYSLEQEKKLESILGIKKYDINNAIIHKIENMRI